MKNLVRAGKNDFSGTCFLMGLTLLLSAAVVRGAEKQEFRSAGLFVEGCSCSIPCTCEISELKHGCQGVGAMTFSGGSYKGVDLAGAKLAYATQPGTWIRFYIQSKDEKQGAALEEFARAGFKEFGKVEAVKKASVEVSGKAGRYTLSVDGGKIMELTTEPVMGLDKKTPISYSNILNPLSPTLMQAKTLKGAYHDGNRSFTLAGSNSFFNGNVHSSGSI